MSTPAPEVPAPESAAPEVPAPESAAPEVPAPERCPRCQGPLVSLAPEEEGDAQPLSYCDRCFMEAILPPPAKVREAPDPRTRAEVEGLPVLERYGRYLCVERLGEGGMGRVWRAWDSDLSRWVALKLLKGRDPKLLARFERESKLVARLGGHANVAQVFEASEVEGQPYIAMQLVEGQTLDAWTQAAPQTIARLLRDAARGVAYAHAQGIVHRDLKPANVMVATCGVEPPGLAPEAQVQVMDFGLARASVSGATISLPGELLGTPEFMSPEQARGEPLDERSDVYSLGATLYAVLTGRAPFLHEEIPALLRRIAEEDPPSPSLFRAGIPTDLVTIVQECLAKEPERRYPSAAELAADLERFLRQEPIRARRPSLLYLLRKRIVRQRRVVGAVALTLGLSLAGYALAVYLPRQRLLERERERLRPLLVQKTAREAEFRDLLQARRFEAAVELARPLHGRRAPLPALEVPAVAREPEFAALHEPYLLDLPRALRLSGAARLGRGDARGKSDLAQAYRVGRDRPQDHAQARGAILDLAARLLGEGSFEDSAGAARLARRNFGAKDPASRAALARALQRLGSLDRAALLWEGLREDAEFGGEARGQLEGLAAWLPRLRIAPLQGAQLWLDLTGDGQPEVLCLGSDWILRALRPTAQGWQELARCSFAPRGEAAGAAPWRVFVRDLEADGTPEIFAYTGRSEFGSGAHVVWGRWREGQLERLGQAPNVGQAIGVLPFDVDGDGTRELLSWTEWPRAAIEVHRLREGRLEPWFAWDTQAHVMDLADLGPGRLLVSLGIWRKSTRGRPTYRVGRSGVELVGEAPQPWGFRLFVLGRDEEGVYREETAAPGRFAAARLEKRSDGSFYVTSWPSPDVAVVVPEAHRGAQIVRYAGGELTLTAPVVSASAALGSLEVGGRERELLRSDDGLVQLVGGGGERVSLRAPGALVRGLADPIFLESDATDLILHGFGPYRPPVSKPGAADEELDQAGELSPVEELLEIGLYQEVLAVLAREAPSAAGSYARGVALERLGREAEALEAYRLAARERGLRVQALLRQGACLERLGRWADLATCAERLLRLPSADGHARRWAAARQRWPRQAGVYHHALKRTEPWTELPLYAENPFKVEASPERLVLWATSEAREAAGVLVAFGEGGFRARIGFVPGQVEWSSAFTLGLLRLRGAGRGETSQELALQETSEGATDRPNRALRWIGRLGKARSAALEGLIEPDLPQSLEIEHVSGGAWSVVRLRGSAGAEQVARFQTPLSFQAGLVLVGSPGWTTWRYNVGAHANRIELRELSFDHASPLEFPSEPQLRGPQHALAWANGLALRGRSEEARAAYAAYAKRVLSGSARARLEVFRALLELREGQEQAARAALAAALESDRASAQGLVRQRRAPALSAVELTWFRRELGLPADPSQDEGR